MVNTLTEYGSRKLMKLKLFFKNLLIVLFYVFLLTVVTYSCISVFLFGLNISFGIKVEPLGITLMVLSLVALIGSIFGKIK